MHAIADKDFVEPLKKPSATKFEARAKDDWAIPAFADAVAEIYQSTAKTDEPIKMMALAVIRSQ